MIIVCSVVWFGSLWFSSLWFEPDKTSIHEMVFNLFIYRIWIRDVFCTHHLKVLGADPCWCYALSLSLSLSLSLCACVCVRVCDMRVLVQNTSQIKHYCEKGESCDAMKGGVVRCHELCCTVLGSQPAASAMMPRSSAGWRVGKMGVRLVLLLTLKACVGACVCVCVRACACACCVLRVRMCV